MEQGKEGVMAQGQEGTRAQEGASAGERKDNESPDITFTA